MYLSLYTRTPDKQNDSTTNSRTEQHTQRDGTEKAVPLAVSLYNQTMGGVDLDDQLTQEYSPDKRQLKMWKRIIWNGLTTAAGKKFAAFSFLFCFCNPINLH